MSEADVLNNKHEKQVLEARKRISKGQFVKNKDILEEFDV